MSITETHEELRFDDSLYIVSKTDLKGNITYANDLFIEISGYSEKELIGTPHNILRHQDMPKAIFKLLWDKIQAGEEIFAYVKNRTKSGKYYWVHAYVTPTFDKNNKIIGYHSVRRSPSPEAIAVISPLYHKMLNAEKAGGTQAAITFLENTLSQLKVSYDAFILSYE
ncbi:MAG: PAS domain-containing protein [Sulfurospirillaceae bacterium]|nr:PAS domain-containing protein [Sulfurospirillaceae bacterium]MDD2827499.1 PAS domain-containing protein [Sulfurospirillaceae bacterium]